MQPAECKKTRSELHISKAQVARWADVSNQTIANFERGDTLSTEKHVILEHIYQALHRLAKDLAKRT